MTLVADGERIRQVLHNLLGNALKFSRPEGTVRVTLQATQQEAVVGVSDEGIGIEPQRLEELFVPFHQIDPGMDRGKGGLGLGQTALLANLYPAKSLPRVPVARPYAWGRRLRIV